MQGCDLKEGFYINELVQDDVLWSSLTSLFTNKSKNSSSYKFGFLKSIIDNLYNVDNNLSLSFDLLFSKFAEVNWNLILKYKLKQNVNEKNGRKTVLEQIINETAYKYSIDGVIPYESLTNDMMEYVSTQVKKRCKRYVVGALYEDTHRRFYSFSKRGEWLQINPQMYEFICKHKLIIEKLNYFEWAKFLEKINEPDQTSLLLNKIDYSSKRNDLSYYRRILYEQFESHNCFYCGKQINPNHADVDHFIPWSFIKDDKLWNLVLACPSCNRKKRDILANKIYLNKINQRNSKLICDCLLESTNNYENGRIDKIYEWALMNGYKCDWKP